MVGNPSPSLHQHQHYLPVPKASESTSQTGKKEHIASDSPAEWQDTATSNDRSRGQPPGADRATGSDGSRRENGHSKVGMDPTSQMISAGQQANGKPAIDTEQNVERSSALPPKQESVTSTYITNGHPARSNGEAGTPSSLATIQAKVGHSSASVPSVSSFLPDGVIPASHSQLFRTPSPPATGDLRGQARLEDLKAELNSESDGLIPLAAVVERVASESYDTLLNLGET